VCLLSQCLFRLIFQYAANPNIHLHHTQHCCTPSSIIIIHFKWSDQTRGESKEFANISCYISIFTSTHLMLSFHIYKLCVRKSTITFTGPSPLFVIELINSSLHSTVTFILSSEMTGILCYYWTFKDNVCPLNTLYTNIY